jgi:hypothetical protein
MMFWFGLIFGFAFAKFGTWWMMAFHDADVINKARKEQWEFDTKWAQQMNACPPPPPNVSVAK